MDFKEFSLLLVQFAEQNMERWNELDGAQGDGDLGVTIVLGARALADTAPNCTTLKQWFQEGGKSLRKAAPSTMGILIASSLIAAGKAMQEEKAAYTLEEWTAIQQTIVDEIQKRGGAKLGDKTVLDALIPAVDTFNDGIAKGKNLEQILAEVVVVAKQSAEQTSSLVSKIGRSSWLGERAQGNIDGGAWVCYQLYDFILKQQKA
jgi:dihydroxyacetone kinase-like protein